MAKITFKVTPKSEGFDLECTIKSAGSVRKLQVSKSDWRGFRKTEIAVHTALAESLFDEMLDGVLDGAAGMFDGLFDKADGQSRRLAEAPFGLLRTFTYEAMNPSGQEVNGEIEAVSSEDALAKIRNLDYFPTRIREKGSSEAETAAAARAMQNELMDDVISRSLGNLRQLRQRNRAVKWCRSHTRTLLLAGIIVLFVLLI